jgi:hypothetical protein
MGNWLFSYDTVDRLMAAAVGASPISVLQCQSAAWSYDRGPQRTIFVRWGG